MTLQKISTSPFFWIAALGAATGLLWYIYKRMNPVPTDPAAKRRWAESYAKQLFGIEQQADNEGRPLTTAELKEIDALEDKIKELGWRYTDYDPNVGQLILVPVKE